MKQNVFIKKHSDQMERTLFMDEEWGEGIARDEIRKKERRKEKERDVKLSLWPSTALYKEQLK